MKSKKIFLFVFLIIAAVFAFMYSYRLLQRQRLPRVALVIDDWGYNLNNISLLRSLDIPITLAILPNLKYSKEIAKEDKFKNRQVILHMPMEPESNFIRLEQHTITTDMSQGQITTIFNKALDSVPNARGVSNHMGSKLTADSKVMDMVLRLLKKKRLFFLDSVATDKSVCEAIASNLKMKFIKRDIFLDNINKINYIKGQLYQLVEIAKRRGYAVGTGHDRNKTLTAIKELIPELKDKVRFIFVSELAKRQEEINW